MTTPAELWIAFLPVDLLILQVISGYAMLRFLTAPL